MSDGEEQSWYRRVVGRRIEKVMNRVLGIALLAVGLVSAGVTLRSEEFTLGTHWPGLAIAGVMIFLARMCFRLRGSVIAEFGDDYIGHRQDVDENR